MKKTISISWLLLVFGCFLLAFSSCKSKEGTRTLTKEDSVLIYKGQLDNKEKIYYMRLTRATIESLFLSTQSGSTPNDVKQIHYIWHTYPGNAYGLDAYGADANGNRLTAAIPLEIPDQRKYVTNWNDIPRNDLYINIRGDYKFLFNSTGQGSDVPIQPGKFTDILFIPEVREYSPTTNSVFFAIKKSTSDLEKIFALGSVIYTNPSPPYNSACLLECDN